MHGHNWISNITLAPRPPCLPLLHRLQSCYSTIRYKVHVNTAGEHLKLLAESQSIHPKGNANHSSTERKHHPVTVISLLHALRHLGSDQGDRLKRQQPCQTKTMRNSGDTIQVQIQDKSARQA